MIIRLIGELYDLLLKGFFVVVIAVIVLCNASEAIQDFKEKRKEKRNKN